MCPLQNNFTASSDLEWIFHQAYIQVCTTLPFESHEILMEFSQDENNKSLSKFTESNSILYCSKEKEVTKIELKPT